VGASAIVATVADPMAFRSGRDFAAWIGLVPRQDSTGGKQKLGPISKQGDRYVRRILVVGAHAVLKRARQQPEKYPWLTQLLARRPFKVKRGTGLSDRELDHPTLEERMDDIRAVMDVVGSTEAAIYGISEGGALAALFAATYPERCRALVLYGAFEKFSTWIKTEAQRQGILAYFDHAWGSGELCGRVVPSLASDSALRDWFRGHERLDASPSAAMTLMRMDSEIDIRHVLPAIRVPTLVLHRGGDTFVDVAAGRYLGAHIPGARYVELQGNDHLPEFGDAEAVLDRIEEFLTGSIAVVERDRVLATVMFVDMVDSTRTAATLGDKAWREVLDRYTGPSPARFRAREAASSNRQAMVYWRHSTVQRAQYATGSLCARLWRLSDLPSKLDFIRARLS
jgi:pimeloyl-ACP methyl ester carboxylesterase